MIKKTALLALAVCLFLMLLSPCPVQAQDKLEILESSAEVDFPTRLSFSLSASSNADITDIRLCYAVEQIQFAEVTSEVYIESTPAPAVDVAWTLEMVKIGGLPPGAKVSYWWLVTDAAGNKAETPWEQVEFADNRYSWSSITEDKVTIYWYEGDESFARELMATAQAALDRLATDTGARLEKPVRLYAYGNTQDLLGAMIYPQEWTGGVAFTRFGTIAIGISPNNLDWGKSTIAHELAHLVVHQVTLNPYGGLPVWLDEGLAMYAEGLLEPQFTSRLHNALLEDRLISTRSLASPFSAHAEAAYLSYAESYSLVEFLVHKYGQAKMLDLLDTFRQGSGYDEALKKVYGFDMEGLNTLWRDYVTEQYLPAEVAAEVTEKTRMHPAFLGLIAALATGLLLALGLAAESWAWRRG